MGETAAEKHADPPHGAKAFRSLHSEPRAASAPCPHFPQCVGCPLIGTRYGAQLEWKHKRLAEALAPYSSLNGLQVPEVIGSPRAFGYRNQAKLVVRRAGPRLLLGLYKPGTHQVVDIGRCPVHQPIINDVLARVRTELERYNVPVYDERTRTGWLRYLFVRISGWQQKAQLILVSQDAHWSGLRSFARALRLIRGVSSVVLNINSTHGNVILGNEFRVLCGENGIIDRVGGLKLRSCAGSFLQPNMAQARRVYAQVVGWAAPQADEVAVDLYSGVGAISFSLASRAGRVWGIEDSSTAVLDAKRNIRLNGFHNVRFTAGETATCLPEITNLVGNVDLITLNPPRKGVDPTTREAIMQAAPSRMVYMSCDPESLARDLEWFAGRKYVPVAIQPFDMLPQTEHVETVVLVIRDG